MNTWNNEELQQVLLKVMRRAATDAAFRKLALQDAAAAIAQVHSKPLPAGVSYKFVDNSGPIRIVPLPDFTCQTDELSEDDLDNVAGGGSTPPPPPLSGGWSKIAPLDRRPK